MKLWMLTIAPNNQNNVIWSWIVNKLILKINLMFKITWPYSFKWVPANWKHLLCLLIIRWKILIYDFEEFERSQGADN